MKPRLVKHNCLWRCFIHDGLRTPEHVTIGYGVTPQQAYANFKINLAKSQSNTPYPFIPFGSMNGSDK